MYEDRSNSDSTHHSSPRNELLQPVSAGPLTSSYEASRQANIEKNRELLRMLQIDALSMSKSGIFSCDQCKVNFRKPSALSRHLESAHGRESPYICQTCGRYFRSAPNLNNHQQTHVRDLPRPHVCDICDRGFVNLDHLQRHERTHLKKKTWKCSECSKCFDRESILLRHLRRSIKCSAQAGAVVEPKIKLEVKLEASHFMNVNGDLCCDECTAIYSGSGALAFLTKHKAGVHTLEDSVVCPRCGLACSNFRSLHQHIYNWHSQDSLHLCVHCGLTFEALDRLYSHEIDAHSKTRPHACRSCKEAFTSQPALKRHQKWRHRKARFQCTICQRSFLERRKYVSHQRSHQRMLSTMDKSYISTSCQEPFRVLGDQGDHFDIHRSKSEQSSFQRPHREETYQEALPRLGALYHTSPTHTTQESCECQECARQPDGIDSTLQHDLTRPPPEDEEYEVEKIIASRRVQVGKGWKRMSELQYLVHWKGYGNEDRTWEPLVNLANAEKLVTEYQTAHPNM
jgi:Chromo (CHRromatin Organisation MOdifier) domain/Zinc finger, C2H2 type